MDIDSVRTWVKDNQTKTALIGCGVAVVIAGIMLAVGLSGGGPGRGLDGEAWFYDLQTGKPFVSDAGRVPPFTTDDGHTAVQAVIRSCGDDGEPFIAYLLRYNAAAAELLRARRDGDDTADTLEASGVIESGVEIAEVPASGEPQWLSEDRPEAGAIHEALSSRCKGAPLRQWPTDRAFE